MTDDLEKASYIQIWCMEDLNVTQLIRIANSPLP